MAFKMKGFSGFKNSPIKQRDTSLTGGSDANVVRGGQVSAWNPQYVPGHQIASSGSEAKKEKTTKKKTTPKKVIKEVKTRVKNKEESSSTKKLPPLGPQPLPVKAPIVNEVLGTTEVPVEEEERKRRGNFGSFKNLFKFRRRPTVKRKNLVTGGFNRIQQKR